MSWNGWLKRYGKSSELVFGGYDMFQQLLLNWKSLMVDSITDDANHKFLKSFYFFIQQSKKDVLDGCDDKIDDVDIDKRWTSFGNNSNDCYFGIRKFYIEDRKESSLWLDKTTVGFDKRSLSASRSYIWSLARRHVLAMGYMLERRRESLFINIQEAGKTEKVIRLGLLTMDDGFVNWVRTYWKLKNNKSCTYGYQLKQ
ncbi:hypothetical protein Tco_1465761 [Tanacetum coccineum]